MIKHSFLNIFIVLLIFCPQLSTSQDILLRNVRLIDGTAKPVAYPVQILIRADTIAAIGENLQAENAATINLEGKTVMPLLLGLHQHIGMLKGNTAGNDHFTPENIERQLHKYLSFGVGAVTSMGTDLETVFPVRDKTQSASWNSALLFTAGAGFTHPQGGPGARDMPQLNRPSTPEEARTMVRKLAPHRPDFIKMWVDDFNGSSPKLSPEICSAIIDEAHRHQIRVVAHLYNLEDARHLVASGLDIIGHSIRDQEADQQLINMMKAKGTVYIPTLSLDEFLFVYKDKPEWLTDPVFSAAAEPGVLEMISSPAYSSSIQNSPSLERNIKGFKIALLNVFRLHQAGVTIGMGTDSGANPVRVQGFSEHLELQLMNEAGIPPLEVIKIATQNGASVLRKDKSGTLTAGNKADFIVLDGNPAINIKNTRKIKAVWKNGKEVSQGPVVHQK